MRIAVLATAVCLSVVGLSAASDVEAAIRRPTNIPAQGLAPALQSLARDRDFQVVYRSEVVGELRTQGASGELTADEALRQLLSGTGLTFRYLDEKTVTIALTASSAPSATDAQETPSAPQAFSDPEARDPGTAKKSGWFERFRLAQNDQSSRTSDSDEQEENSPQSSDKNSENRVIDEVVVTGTHIRGVKDIASPSRVITREEIDSAGFQTVEQLLEVLPENFAAVSPDARFAVGASTLALNNFEYVSAIDLRGLGAEATLSLINGRRIGRSIQGRVVDVSAIPLSAIERVEIVSGGASAIYGADAVAGVVNYITRRDFDGMQSRISYGGPTGYGGGQRFQASQIFGHDFGGGSIFAAYDYRRDWGSNFLDLGMRSSDQLLSGRTYNYSSFQGDLEQHSGLVSGTLALSDRIEFYADLLYMARRV